MTKTKMDTTTAISGASWFTVDKAGLAQLLTRKHGKLHAIIELVSNAWDAPGTHEVAVVISEWTAGTYVLVVEDDDPEGFADLTHAYTVFAPSTKKGDALKRGRFNLGEKLVLALCNEASISTTKGTVRFTAEGQRVVVPEKRERGSEFKGVIRMTKVEAEEAIIGLQTLIAPQGILTLVNGEPIVERQPTLTFEAYLETEVADLETGNLRRTNRTGEIELYIPHAGEKPTIYEMGIPVVKSNGFYHVNIMQKVPLNMDRDNVTPGYARRLHVHVLNHTYEILPKEEFTSAWAKGALGNEHVKAEAVMASVKARFGDKVVANDPTDPEANRLAVAQGYVLVHGGSLSGEEWSRVKDAGAILPAGKVTPSPRVEFANAGETDMIPEADWTPGMLAMARHTERFGDYAGLSVRVSFVNLMSVGFLACCGPSGSLTYNMGRLGRRWFEEIGEAQDALMLHELGHIRVHGAEAGHLSAEYPDEIARLGAKLARYYLVSPLPGTSKLVKQYVSPEVN